MATESARALWGVPVAPVPSVAGELAGPGGKLAAFRQRPFFEDKNRAFWILQSVGWSGYFILRVLSGLANGLGVALVIHALLLTAAGYSITLLMASAYRRIIRQQSTFTWSVAIVIVILGSVTYSAIETWSYATFLNPGATPGGVEFFGAMIFDFAIIGAWSALYFSINYFILLEEQADRMTRLENQASAAQLAMLRYQLNPHFLFNTLNSISTLVLLKQTERANAMLSRLSSFLRYTLANEATAQVALGQEIETTKAYLEIEKMRFEDRLRTHFSLDPAAQHARVPSLLLQPIVENAIKYAVTPHEEGADISIEARRVGDRLKITVSDTGPGPGAASAGSPSTGVGLANIRDRLREAYGADHQFESRTVQGGGYAVTIDVPYDAQLKDAA